MSEIKRVAIVGAGYMGTQIGLQCAAHGFATSIYDPVATAREQAQQLIERELDRRIAASESETSERSATSARLSYSDSLEKTTAAADLIIEAIPEQLELKRQLFTQLDALCPAEAIFATNSSSIKISNIESATQRLDKVLNLHFYGTVWERPMVELMRGSSTSDATIETVYRFAQAIAITPLIVDRESTGFIFNRVWRAVKRETLHLVEEGVSSHEDVDRAWMIFTGMQMGPFALMDRIGLDVICDIERVYYKESGDERDAPPPLLIDKVERGELGRKSGRGFYSYPNPAFEAPDWLKGGR
jgi:3-hydroxybutyryl-CoA dehydrogenase